MAAAGAASAAAGGGTAGHSHEEALAQFVEAARVMPKAAPQQIELMLAHKAVFVFSEMLALPAVQQLAGTAHEGVLRKLEVFAYGTYQEAKAMTPPPTMTDQQLRKLKQLSIVSMAYSCKALPYDRLQSELDIETVRELENMVMDCVASGLLKAKLDHRNRQVLVSDVFGRDVRPESVDTMIRVISAWQTQAKELEAVLGALSFSVQDASAAGAQETAALLTKMKKIAAEAKTQEPDLDMSNFVYSDLSSRSRLKRSRIPEEGRRGNY